MDNTLLNQQLHLLKKAKGGPEMRGMQFLLALLSMVMLITSLVTLNLLFAGVFIALAVASFFSGQRMKHLDHAIKALDVGQALSCQATIQSNGDAQPTYTVQLQGRDAKQWQFECSALAWQPHIGTCELQVYYLDNVKWPVLAMAEQGVLVPDSKPRLLRSS